MNKIRARHLADKGVKGASSALRLITKLDKVVAAILIGNNLVNIIISSLATIIFVSLFRAYLGGSGLYILFNPISAGDVRDYP